MSMVEIDNPRVSMLLAGGRKWWDVVEHKMVNAYTIYLAQGCPDWGETDGKRNQLCTFCSIPNAVAMYREIFYGGCAVPQKEHRKLFHAALRIALTQVSEPIHTLMIFNGGSFIAPEANEVETQKAVMRAVVKNRSIKRVVVESRAELITEERIRVLTDILFPAGVQLTIRIGVETKNNILRMKVLKKGHSRRSLEKAVKILKSENVQVGGYILLKPAPYNGLCRAMECDDVSETDLDYWAVHETQETMDWILQSPPHGLGMDEAYFCSTNVGTGSVIEEYWKRGEFEPANLWMVLTALKYGIRNYGARIHLLPFKEEPPLLAIPSNHVHGGLPQDLSGAVENDVMFHRMLDEYRTSMDPEVLYTPECKTKPDWYT